MKLSVVRHGETDWNIEHRIMGHLDIGLNANGMAQAAAVAARLAGEHYDVIVSSDLQRAVVTARAIA
ncbi:MAG: histidine phosphatase family protein, partial [Bacillota bacterium]